MNNYKTIFILVAVRHLGFVIEVRHLEIRILNCGHWALVITLAYTIEIVAVILKIRLSVLSDFASSYKMYENRTISCLIMSKIRYFPIWRPDSILNLKVLIFGQTALYHNHRLIQCIKLYEQRLNNFHISGRPPSWICDDVIILNSVMDF